MAPALIYMSGSILPSSAANSVHVMKMSDAFASSGIDTTLIGLRGDDLATQELRAAYGVSDRFAIRLVPQEGAVNYRLRYALGILTNGWAPRDALIYTRVPKVAALAAMLRKPCMLELHHPPTRGDEAALRKHLQARTGGRLVVITQALKNWAVETVGVEPGDVLVAHDGADPFAPGVQPALPPAGKIRVGYLGHLYPGKGGEIITQLAPRLPELDFIVVGGMAEDVARWKAETAGVGNLRFVGHVPHRETLAWLRTFDIALLPNQRCVSIFGGGVDIGRWTSPLKAFEYMAAGLPIIASDLENIREVLTHERTALLCPPEAVDRWEEALRRLASDSALRQTLGQRGAHVLAQRYTWTERARMIATNLGLQN